MVITHWSALHLERPNDCGHSWPHSLLKWLSFHQKLFSVFFLWPLLFLLEVLFLSSLFLVSLSPQLFEPAPLVLSPLFLLLLLFFLLSPLSFLPHLLYLPSFSHVFSLYVPPPSPSGSLQDQELSNETPFVVSKALTIVWTIKLIVLQVVCAFIKQLTSIWW